MGSCGFMVRPFVCDPLGQPGRALLALWHRGLPLPRPCTIQGLGWQSVLLDKDLPVRAGKGSAGQTNNNGGNNSHTLSGQILLGSSEPLGRNCQS